MAAQLAHLQQHQQAQIERPDVDYTVGWSRGRETLRGQDTDWNKGSFYANPLCDDPSRAAAAESLACKVTENLTLMPANVWPSDSLPELEPAFKGLGRTLCEVATLLLQHCDGIMKQQEGLSTPLRAAGPSHSNTPAPQAPPSAITTSAAEECQPHSARIATPLQLQFCNKGRLLHYYSVSPGDNGLWCGWHDDFGILTALTSAMYLPSGSCAAGDEVPNPEPQRGLVVRTRSGAVVAVRTRPGQVLFQAGLSLQILSGGLLRATPHAVLAPQNAQHGLTRSTFAVFCNPNAGDELRPLYGSPDHSVPHWRPGMTFGEFADATTAPLYN